MRIFCLILVLCWGLAVPLRGQAGGSAMVSTVATEVARAQIGLEGLRRLMEERLALMPDVARHKWNRQSPIEDLPREETIIASLRMQAQALGVPGVWAARFFRAQIEAAKQIQREHFARWQQAGQGKFEDVPDLDKVIRPRLDVLTPQLLQALVLAWPALADAGQQPKIAAAMQGMGAVVGSEAAARMAVMPLVDGSAGGGGGGGGD